MSPDAGPVSHGTLQPPQPGKHAQSGSGVRNRPRPQARIVPSTPLAGHCQACGARHCQCLHDVRDPSAFVHATIVRFCRANSNRGAIVLSHDERDELHCEGMAILLKLSREYKPHMPGYAQAGCFSGYAAMFLPRKLGDAWHRLHPEHRHVSQPDGGRRWVYGERAVSLEALTADDPDRHQIMSTGVPRYDLAGRLHSALVARARAEQTWTVEVAKRIGKGEQPAAVAAALGLDEQSVFRHMRAIARAAPNPRHQFSKISELRAALEQLAERDADTAARVGHELSEGATAGDVAAMLKIDISEVRDHEDAIRRVWHQIESEAG